LTTSSSFLYYSHTRFFLRIVVSIIIHIAPSFALVPYTTLFRSRVAVGVHSVSEELGEVALPHHGDDQEHESNTGDQQDRLDHLHVGGALHAADEDVGHHHQADDHDDDGLGSLGVQVQQDGDEGAGTGHLSDQVEQRGEQGRESCGHAYRALLQAEGKYVRHGELTGVTQRRGDQ